MVYAKSAKNFVVQTPSSLFVTSAEAGIHDNFLNVLCVPSFNGMTKREDEEVTIFSTRSFRVTEKEFLKTFLKLCIL
jgi:hypothetical protein